MPVILELQVLLGVCLCLCIHEKQHKKSQASVGFSCTWPVILHVCLVVVYFGRNPAVSQYVCMHSWATVIAGWHSPLMIFYGWLASYHFSTWPVILHVFLVVVCFGWVSAISPLRMLHERPESFCFSTKPVVLHVCLVVSLFWVRSVISPWHKPGFAAALTVLALHSCCHMLSFTFHVSCLN